MPSFFRRDATRRPEVWGGCCIAGLTESAQRYVNTSGCRRLDWAFAKFHCGVSVPVQQSTIPKVLPALGRRRLTEFFEKLRIFGQPLHR